MKLIAARMWNKERQRFIGVRLDNWIHCCENLKNDMHLYHMEWIIERNSRLGIVRIVGFDFVPKHDNSQKYHSCPYCLSRNEVQEIDEKDASNPILDVKYRRYEKY